MAIIGQIPRSELGTKYTRYGRFCGLCPVYIGNINSDAPTIVERNWIPGWWMSFVTSLFGCFIFVNTLLDDEYEPMFPIAIGAPIGGWIANG